MEPQRDLQGDCARCQGLCCVSLAFDRSAWFAFDKRADEACPELLESNRCRLHARLEPSGNSGCANYDCYGAGQRVTQELFPGVSWRRAPELRRAMTAAFLRLRDVQELRLLLHQAARLPLGETAQAESTRLLGLLEPAEGFTPAKLAELDVATLKSAVGGYLRALRPLVERHAKRPRRLPLAR